MREIEKARERERDGRYTDIHFHRDNKIKQKGIQKETDIEALLTVGSL